MALERLAYDGGSRGRTSSFLGVNKRQPRLSPSLRSSRPASAEGRASHPDRLPGEGKGAAAGPTRPSSAYAGRQRVPSYSGLLG